MSSPIDRRASPAGGAARRYRRRRDGHGFRPDIEGLRAVAVLGVVPYHAGVGWLSGGFVGVDVFFVISGYLITDMLWRELGARRGLSFAALLPVLAAGGWGASAAVTVRGPLRLVICGRERRRRPVEQGCGQVLPDGR